MEVSQMYDFKPFFYFFHFLNPLRKGENRIDSLQTFKKIWTFNKISGIWHRYYFRIIYFIFSCSVFSKILPMTQYRI
mgnify:CR=1 FL=1